MFIIIPINNKDYSRTVNVNLPVFMSTWWDTGDSLPLVGTKILDNPLCLDLLCVWGANWESNKSKLSRLKSIVFGGQSQDMLLSVVRCLLLWSPSSCFSVRLMIVVWWLWWLLFIPIEDLEFCKGFTRILLLLILLIVFLGIWLLPFRFLPILFPSSLSLGRLNVSLFI